MGLMMRLRACRNDARVLEGEDGLVVADVRSHIGEEDARRLAACWNACVGIPTEKLEAGGLTTALSILRLAAAPPGVARLAQVRAEARHALREISDDRCTS